MEVKMGFYDRVRYNWYDKENPPPSASLSKGPCSHWYPPDDAEPITEFPSYYITPEGKIYNNRGNEIAASPDTKGYLKVCLYKDNQRYTRRVHVMVAKQFLEVPEGLGDNPVVDHIDQDRTHCSVDNLQWVSQSKNIAKAYEQGKIVGTAVPVRCIEDDKTFFSCTQAANFYGLSKVTIKQAIEDRNGYVKRIDKHFEYSKQ